MWIYKRKTITTLADIPKDSFGFVYLITNLTNGRKYLGCKQLFTKRKRRFGKREIAAMKDKRKKTYEYVVKESNWLDYTGSNKDLNEDIKKGHKIKKEILIFVKTKKQLTYYEVKEQFKNSVLESDDWYNGNILKRFYNTEEYLNG